MLSASSFCSRTAIVHLVLNGPRRSCCKMRCKRPSHAGNTRLYLQFCHSDTAVPTARLENCITDIGNWMSTDRLKLNMDKTKWLLAGSKQGLSRLGNIHPELKLGATTIAALDSVRLRRVDIKSGLSRPTRLESHSHCFYWLCQLWRIRRLLDAKSTATLVGAFVNSRTDYCNSVLVSAPKALTDKLQRVPTAAACITSNTGKLDRGLTQLVHEKLHWFNVQDRVMFQLVFNVHQCLNGWTPQYLAVGCIHCPASDIFVPLSEIYCMYDVTDSTHMAAGLLPLLVRLPGTVSWSLSAIRTPPKLLSGAC